MSTRSDLERWHQVGNRFLISMIAMATVAAIVVIASAPAAGQPLPTPATTWNPSLTPDGQPDIGGHWSQRNGITTYSIQEGAADRAEHISITGQEAATGRPIIDPPDGRIPYQPWAAERSEFLYDQHRQPSRVEYVDPVSRSFLDGVPRINYRNTMRIVQTPGQVVMINEYNHTYRVIPIDGSPHIGPELKLWMGDSRGHWEDNTLVVDVTNNNEHTWFDIVGSFHSDALHVVERWTFVSPERIDYEATIEDPKVFTKPWTILVNMGRQEDYEIWEFAIWEGNLLVENVLGAAPEVRRNPW